MSIAMDNNSVECDMFYATKDTEIIRIELYNSNMNDIISILSSKGYVVTMASETTNTNYTKIVSDIKGTLNE